VDKKALFLLKNCPALGASHPDPFASGSWGLCLCDLCEQFWDL